MDSDSKLTKGQLEAGRLDFLYDMMSRRALQRLPIRLNILWTQLDSALGSGPMLKTDGTHKDLHKVAHQTDTLFIYMS